MVSLSSSCLGSRLSYLEPSEAKRVGNDGKRACCHGCRCHDWVEETEITEDEVKSRGDTGLAEGKVENSGGHRNESSVIGERPEEVLLYGSHGALAQRNGSSDSG